MGFIFIFGEGDSIGTTFLRSSLFCCYYYINLEDLREAIKQVGDYIADKDGPTKFFRYRGNFFVHQATGDDGIIGLEVIANIESKPFF